jgi:hypothetical protein
MPHDFRQVNRASAIDRNLVRQLVVEHKNHIALLTTLRGDVHQSKIDHVDMVNSYMACLSHNDRLCFAMLYAKEMDLHGTAG